MEFQGLEPQSHRQDRSSLSIRELAGPIGSSKYTPGDELLRVYADDRWSSLETDSLTREAIRGDCDEHALAGRNEESV